MRDSFPLGRGRHHFFPKRSFNAPLGEDLSPSEHCIATESSGYHRELHVTPRQRQVARTSPIAAVNSLRNRAARQTYASFAGMPDDSSNAFVGCALNYKACRDESRRVVSDALR